ncbi:U3 small nucleolar RNA-associated protein 25 homolog [Convolutriloba macropyga]|uniref:U3 small nucleolar RNA-associated protein 25 homolog n=1 Tax=Convolutriloba macropyga TaxID=536237 RepID=UPI003F521C72
MKYVFSFTVMKRKSSNGLVEVVKKSRNNLKQHASDIKDDQNGTISDSSDQGETTTDNSLSKSDDVVRNDDPMMLKFFRTALSVSETENFNRADKKEFVDFSESDESTENQNYVLKRLQSMYLLLYEQMGSTELSIFDVCRSYKDFVLPSLSSRNYEFAHRSIALHILNHVLKTRTLVLRHNKELQMYDQQGTEYQPDDYRDQCITRPSCLILTPFRNSAYNIVKIIMSLFEDSKKHKITKKKRFEEDFGPKGFEPISEYRPQDYLDMMNGNIDDDFKIGLSISPKQIRMYSHFYRADVIVASPLGLFQIVGDARDKKREHDFLSGIQVVCLDQADVFLMQNWSHVNTIFESLNVKPSAAHEVNFARVHEWCLDEQMRYFRQTIITSRFKAPEFNSIVNKFCHNFSGLVELRTPTITEGELNRVVNQLVHVFRRFPVASCAEQDTARFEFFTNQILKELRDLPKCKIVLFISDYFDFVKIRNYLRRNKYNFVPISEYDTYQKARDKMKKFRRGEIKFLLITERFHFFNRLFIKGIERLFFYQLPRYAHFYSELCNMIGIGNEKDSVELSCSAIFCKYDCLRLLPIVNEENCRKILNTENLTHMFITGEK